MTGFIFFGGSILIALGSSLTFGSKGLGVSLLIMGTISYAIGLFNLTEWVRK